MDPVPLSQPVNLQEYEALARDRLPADVYDYYAGGAADEITVRENRASWDRVRLRPRMLVDVTNRDLTTTVLGQPVSMPVLTAPCAFNSLAHSEGERAVARATAAAGIIQVVSTGSSYSLEEIAAESTGLRWFQLYCYRDRGVVKMLIERAAAAGYRALCVTIDAQVIGRRERDVRNRFRLPEGLCWRNLEPYGLHQMTRTGAEPALQKYISGLYDLGLTWEALEWMRSVSALPMLVKGILTAEDACLAIDAGMDGLIVSNHGGRQLDGVVTGCEVLPEVLEAVGGRAEVLVDGGIRRGTDVIKALALGARAVLIGRPYLWGLAVGGEAGVLQVLELLRNEIDLAMALCGKPRIMDIDASAIRRTL